MASMTEAELLALIKEGESLRLEFKRDAPLSEAELVEAVACLANTGGRVGGDGASGGQRVQEGAGVPSERLGLQATWAAHGLRLQAGF